MPDAKAREAVHAIIFNELCQGIVSDQSRRALHDIISSARDEGADSVILGCTEIGLLLEGLDAPLPLLDSTELHVAMGLEWMLGA